MLKASALTYEEKMKQLEVKVGEIYRASVKSKKIKDDPETCLTAS